MGEQEGDVAVLDRELSSQDEINDDREVLYKRAQEIVGRQYSLPAKDKITEIFETEYVKDDSTNDGRESTQVIDIGTGVDSQTRKNSSVLIVPRGDNHFIVAKYDGESVATSEYNNGQVTHALDSHIKTEDDFLRRLNIGQKVKPQE